MINSQIPEYVILQIFSFLDKFSLREYDSAMTSKEYRPVFLEILKSFEICTIDRWSYLRGIRSSVGHCKFYNIKCIPDICTDLVIYGRARKKSSVLDIQNDNIRKLRIDLLADNIVFNTLKAKNLEKLTIVNIEQINVNIFTKLAKNCPTLAMITLINYNKIHTYEMVNTLINNEKIKVVVKKLRSHIL